MYQYVCLALINKKKNIFRIKIKKQKHVDDQTCSDEEFVDIFLFK